MTNCSHRAIHYKSSVRGIELVTIASARQFPRHAHDQFGMGLILRGGHRSWSGIGMVEAFQGDVIMANPGEIHDGLPMAGQTRIWQMIYLDPSFILGALSGEATSSFEIVHPVATDAKLARYIKRLFVNLLRPDADPQFRDESLLETLMQMRTRHTVAQCEPESRPCLAKALERLDSTPDTGVSLAELASVCGLSRFQFLRAFRAAFNITPHAYLMQKRTGRAKALLARGVLPVEAAVMSGFADQSHLTRNFLRQFGITPARYAASIR